MPRPFRNPVNRAQIELNRVWRVQQYNFPPVDREADARWTSDWQQDHLRCAELLGEMEWVELPLFDPFEGAALDPPRRRPARLEGQPRELEDNAEVLRRYTELKLEKLPEGEEIKRDIKLPPFRVDYDSHEQINQKLNGTVVMIKNIPYLVQGTAIQKGKFALILNNGEDVHGWLYYDDVKDCRGIAPGYFSYRGSAAWVYRTPDRQNSQGMCHRNTHYKLAGGLASLTARPEMLLQTLGNAKNVRYSPNLSDLITGGANQSLRLSDHVALYKSGKKGAPIGVEYCGRPLGLIIRDEVKVIDENDLVPSWIHKDLVDVNLHMVA